DSLFLSKSRHNTRRITDIVLVITEVLGGPTQIGAVELSHDIPRSVPERASTAHGSHETGSSKKSLGPAGIVGYRNCLVTIQRKAEFPVPPNKRWRRPS